MIAVSAMILSTMVSGCSGAKGDINHTLDTLFSCIKNSNSAKVASTIDVPPALQSQSGNIIAQLIGRLDRVESYTLEDVAFLDDNESARVMLKVRMTGRAIEPDLTLNMHKAGDDWKLDLHQRF